MSDPKFQDEVVAPSGSPGWLTCIFFAVALGVIAWNRDRLGSWTGALIAALFLAFFATQYGPGLVWYFRNWPLHASGRLAERGDVDEAIRMVEDHIRARGPSAAAFHQLGALFALKGNWEDCLDAVQAAGDFNNDAHVELAILKNKAVALWQLKRHEEAEACFRLLLQRTRDDVPTICNYGIILTEMGRRSEAMDCLEDAESALENAPPPNTSSRTFSHSMLAELRKALNAPGPKSR